MIPQRSGEMMRFSPVWLKDPFVELQKWGCRRLSEAAIDVFLLPACLLTTFIDPYDLGMNSGGRSRELNIDKMKCDTIHLLKAIAD